jgi:hypothetical protein
MFQFVIRHSSIRQFRFVNRQFRFVNRQSSIVNCYVSLLILLTLFVFGCHKKSSVEAPEPKEAVEAAPVEPAPPAITPEVRYSSKGAMSDSTPDANADAAFNSFDLGETDFYAGRYQQAALSFETFLDNNPQAENRDRAWFLMGLARAMADGSARSQLQSESALKQLISEFPDSPYRRQAEYILDLKTEIERLRADVRKRNQIIKELDEELKRLKQIDMQRKPSRN